MDFVVDEVVLDDGLDVVELEVLEVVVVLAVEVVAAETVGFPAATAVSRSSFLVKYWASNLMPPPTDNVCGFVEKTV